MWQLSHRADPKAVPIADRHYNRQKVGAPQFAPPGRCLVLATPNYDALWITSFPFAQYVKHAWAGAYVCTMFRNESNLLSSDLIREAVALTRWYWTITPSWYKTPEPELGMITFVDASQTRHKRDPGRCFRRAGFEHVGFTKSGLYTLQLRLVDMPVGTAANAGGKGGGDNDKEATDEQQRR